MAVLGLVPAEGRKLSADEVSTIGFLFAAFVVLHRLHLRAGTLGVEAQAGLYQSLFAAWMLRR